MDIPRIFENAGFLAIDKPYGMVVNRSENAPTGTLQDWIEEKHILHEESASKESAFRKRSGIVHRLDKDTSGVLLIAKHEAAFLYLQQQFAERKVTKKYSALVHGKLIPHEGILNFPIGRLPQNRRKFGVIPGGREASTEYRVISCYSYPPEGIPYTYTDVYPKTGRTHQIRVHFSYIGHALLSDSLYCTSSDLLSRDFQLCSRIFLHAHTLDVSDPVTQKKIRIEAKLPQDLMNVLNKLVPLSENNQSAYA